MPKFSIGPFEFPTKVAARAACRALLYSSPAGGYLSGEHLRLAKAILEDHPRADEKLSGGCKAIRVVLNKIPGQSDIQRGLTVVHDDNSTTEFSVYVLFHTDRWGGIKEACRESVKPSTAPVKHRAFASGKPVYCAQTGVLLTWETARVDHDAPWPFRRIFKEWMDGRAWKRPKLVDHGTYRLLAPPDLEDFREFHDARAKLRVVHYIPNSSDAHNRKGS